jgi:hypothetical protein
MPDFLLGWLHDTWPKTVPADLHGYTDFVMGARYTSYSWYALFAFVPFFLLGLGLLYLGSTNPKPAETGKIAKPS